jgi:small-conductance mechanosensitive channel
MTPEPGPAANRVGSLLESLAEPLVGLRDAVVSVVTEAAWFVPALQATILLAIGYVAARLARLAVSRGLRTLAAQQMQLAQRAAFWGVLSLFAVSAMRELGFEFGVVLGAAGIVTVALGFASQTSASNLISGLFLVLERSIESGDVIRVDGITGEVLSIDLLSTQLRTFDNLLVRIPNETMVKTQITNLARLPIRRVDLRVGVGYGSDLGEALRLLRQAAQDEPLILDEPAPIVIAQGFGESSIDYQFSVWATTSNYLEVRNKLQQAVKRAFDEGGVEIPFPQRTLHGGPLEVRLAEGEPSTRRIPLSRDPSGEAADG